MGERKKTAAIRCLSDKGILDRPARPTRTGISRTAAGSGELPYAKLCQLGIALQLEKRMRTLTAYWIGVVIVLAVLNGIRALPAGSRVRRSMWNMGIGAAVLGSLAIIALKSSSQNAKSPSAPDAQQGTETSTSIVAPDDII